MNRAQTTGIVLMVGAALQMLLFLFGITRRSYAALALPVAAAMTTLTALTFWLGLSMLRLQDDEQDDSPTSVG